MVKVVYLLFATLVFISISCATTTDNLGDKPKVGEKNGVCDSGGICNPGLQCIDLVCKDDPCYESNCSDWRECRQGTCELKLNRCDFDDDCSEDNAICDVNHNCNVQANSCKHQNCSGKGKCVLDGVTNEPSCNCDPGYNNDNSPLICEKDSVVDLCENVTCDSWKTCNASNGNCDLVPGRCGSNDDCLGDKDCDANNNCIDPADPCGGITCNNHGECAIVNDLAKCICDNDNGYYPDSTGLNCLNPCSGNENCGGFGVCNPSNATTATCQCNNGYEDINLNCVKVDLCENVNCSEWKPCNELTGQCTLATNRCDTNNDCNAGKECDSNHNCITPNDPCDGVSCSNHGTCIVNGEQAICNCDTNNGYYPSGLSCLNPCEGETCSNNGTCIPSNATRAICQCNNGYHDVGLTCIEDDPCANITCNDSWKECRAGSCELIEGKCDTDADCSTVTPACINNSCIDRCDNLSCNPSNTQECMSDVDAAICVCKTGYAGDLCNDCADGYTNNNGLCEPYTVWCKLQSPLTVNQEKNSIGELVFARVYVSGITEASTESSLIKGELGYGLDNVTLPIDPADYIWLSASYNSSCSDCNNNDEYMANFPTGMLGDFKYIYRFSIDNGTNWLYCDSDGVGGVNSDPFDVNLVGTATITEPSASEPSLIITEVVDHFNTNARYLEFYADGGDINLSGWKLKLYANANANPNATYSFPDTVLSAGTTFVVANNVSGFNTEFGFMPGNATNTNAALSNGDDNFELVNPFGVVVDVYGVPGTDGTTKAWEMVDSSARRNLNIKSGNTVWTDSEWTITTYSDATPGVR